MQEHQHDAEVRGRQRQPFDAADALFQEGGGDQQHERRRQEQDQPLQPGRDVLQAKKIEKARQVIADQPEPDQTPAIGHRERRRMAHLPQRHRREHRQRKHHAKRDQGDRIDVIAVQQFGDDGLGGETLVDEQRQGGDVERQALGLAGPV